MLLSAYGQIWLIQLFQIFLMLVDFMAHIDRLYGKDEGGLICNIYYLYTFKVDD